MRINIAIDGPSAAGKSTIADLLAEQFNYIHLDTGAMYRCVALAAKRAGIAYKDYRRLYHLLKKTEITFDPQGRVYLNGEDVSEEIRTNEISLASSDVSTIKCVRADLVRRQQDFAAKKGIIMDGRDIGTVVLKDAEVKIYLTASAESRARRRYLQDKEKGIEQDFDKLVEEINARDYQDIHRTNSPLRRAEDALYVDTSDMNIPETIAYINKLIEEKIPEGVN